MNVSITFQNTGDARSIIDAITADNPESVRADFPAMVKIDCPQRLVVKRTSIEERIGRAFDLQELQLSLISLSRNIDEGDDELVLAWST